MYLILILGHENHNMLGFKVHNVQVSLLNHLHLETDIAPSQSWHRKPGGCSSSAAWHSWDPWFDSRTTPPDVSLPVCCGDGWHLFADWLVSGCSLFLSCFYFDLKDQVISEIIFMVTFKIQFQNCCIWITVLHLNRKKYKDIKNHFSI